ncbi:MAG: tetratricopeptide repeat protein [Deltaproteobacteria bacterium]|nr:tetratricopeptide repeat protein [Deltaproteobacteria bacterium]
MIARRAADPRVRLDTAQVARIVGVPPRRLRQAVGAGLVTPRRDGRGRLRFDFVDLVLLRTMRGLLEKRVPVRQIGTVLTSLRRQIGERPLTRLSVYADGRRVVAWDGASRWQPDSGQFLFNFDAAQVIRGARKVTRLRVPVPPRRASELSADDWYDLAIELEESSPLEARAAYHHALDLEPTHVTAHINLGRLLHGDGNFASAELHYRAATDVEPVNGLAWYNLGVLLEDAERPNDALPCYENAVRHQPDLADAHYNLALLYEQAHRQRDAVRHLLIFRRLTHRRR